MTILFAVDLREPPAVIAEAERFAAKLEADLLVLHVNTASAGLAQAPLFPTSGFAGFDDYAHYDPALERRLEEAEGHAFLEFLRRFEHPVRAAVGHGNPAETILDDARKYGVDMIIMGKRHHSALERFFIGSVTRSVVEHAVHPTLLIPIHEED